MTRVDPQLRALLSNGGPTPTMALRPTSPAIDAGGDCGGTDQRGAPRDRRCDAGAYELVRCLGKPVDIVGTPGDDELSGGRGPDVFLGLAGDDEFQGSIGKDRACGGPGRDLLIAGPGNDRFWGEGGNDRVKGESGDDLLSGGPGRDRLAGGPGDDVCDFDRRDAHARCEIFVRRRRPSARHERRYLTRRRRSRGQYTTSTLAFRCSPRTGPNCRESVEAASWSPSTQYSSSPSVRSPTLSPGMPTMRFTIS